MGRKDTGPFRVGERVLVPHTDKYYAAKVGGSSLQACLSWAVYLRCCPFEALSSNKNQDTPEWGCVSWQTLKAEKRNDGVFYYLIHYNVRPHHLHMPSQTLRAP